MTRKGIHITVSDRLMKRFEACLEYEGLSKTSLLVSKIQEFCDKVEEKKFMMAGQAKAMDEASRQAPANWEMESINVSDEILLLKDLLKEVEGMPAVKGSQRLEVADLSAEVLKYRAIKGEGHVRLDYQLKEGSDFCSLRMERVNVSQETKELWIERAAKNSSDPHGAAEVWGQG